MSSKFSSSVRREYLGLSPESHERLYEATKGRWKTCYIAITIFAIVSPAAVVIVSILGLRQLLPGLSPVAGATASVIAVLVMVLGPRLIFKATRGTARRCIQAASFRRFIGERPDG